VLAYQVGTSIAVPPPHIPHGGAGAHPLPPHCVRQASIPTMMCGGGGGAAALVDGGVVKGRQCACACTCKHTHF